MGARGVGSWSDRRRLAYDDRRPEAAHLGMLYARTGAWLALLGVLAANGCGRRPTPTDPAVAFDPELVHVDPGSFHQRFDGSASKLVLGTGWYGIEQIEKTGPWSDFSWASRSAHVYFGMPASRDMQLVARLAPFSYPGGPPQTVVPVCRAPP